MILEKVGLVDVKKSAICVGEQAGLETFLAIAPAPVRDRARRRRDPRWRRAGDRRPARSAKPISARPLRVFHSVAKWRSRRDHNYSGSQRQSASWAAARASARTAVDLPVPRSPKASTPPTDGSTAAIMKESFMLSWPTIAENGNGEDIENSPLNGLTRTLRACPSRPCLHADMSLLVNTWQVSSTVTAGIWPQARRAGGTRGSLASHYCGYRGATICRAVIFLG